MKILLAGLLFITSVNAAEYIKYDDPYYIYEGTSYRWAGSTTFLCIEWEDGEKVAKCWANGVPLNCSTRSLELNKPKLVCIYAGQ